MKTKKNTKTNAGRKTTEKAKPDPKARQERWAKHIAEIIKDSVGERLPPAAVKALEAKEGRPIETAILDFMRKDRGLVACPWVPKKAAELYREIDADFDMRGGNARKRHEYDLAFFAARMFLVPPFHFRADELSAEEWRAFIDRHYRSGDRGFRDAELRAVKFAASQQGEARLRAVLEEVQGICHGVGCDDECAGALEDICTICEKTLERTGEGEKGEGDIEYCETPGAVTVTVTGEAFRNLRTISAILNALRLTKLETSPSSILNFWIGNLLTRLGEKPKYYGRAPMGGVADLVENIIEDMDLGHMEGSKEDAAARNEVREALRALDVMNVKK